MTISEPIDPNELYATDPDGEYGNVTVTSSSVDCSATSANLEGTISYEASGLATGPYSGIFTESGTFEINGAGEITSFSATFRIDSATGEVINGTKSAEDVSGSVTCYNNFLGAVTATR